MTLGPARVDVYEVAHDCGSPPFAIRLTTPSGHVVGYSGDSQWTDVLVEAAEGCDLFIAEAYFYDKRVKWHLDYATLLRQRSRLGARRLIATHLSADLLTRVDSLEIEIAHDGLLIEL